MNFLGIGIGEIVFILVLVLIILGPADMVKAGQTLGKFLRRIMTSPTWRAVQRTSQTMRTLPNKLAREAGLDELKEEITRNTKIPDFQKDLSIPDSEVDFGAWTQIPDNNTIGKPGSDPPASDAPPPPQTTEQES